MSYQNPTLNDVPPHDDDAEKAVLGAVLLDERGSALDSISSLLLPNDFYRLENKIIFEAYLSLINQGKPIDTLTLSENLMSGGKFETAGGASYIATISNAVPSYHNIKYYAERVRNMSVRRQLINTSRDIINDSYEGSLETSLLLEKAEKKIFSIADEISNNSFIRLGEALGDVIQDILNRESLKDSISGISSGFRQLDQKTLGFHPSELTIIGARPGIGKTAFALNLATHASLTKKISIGFFSLEMSKNSIIERIISKESRIDQRKLRMGGSLSNNDYSNLMAITGRLDNAPLYIEDTPNIKLFDLRAQARRMKMLHDVKIIFIDYLGLISLDNNNIPKYEQMSEISKSLKGLARELNIPIVALSQVGRQTEGSRPSLADIRGSGSIEQDADVVIFLYRDRKEQVENSSTDEEEQRFQPLEIDVMIAKQRNGAIGDIKMHFHPHHMLFTEIEMHHS